MGPMNDLAPAAEVRPAATVMLVRDSGAGGPLEVLLLRRHLESVFAAGAWVFPGGQVDEADRQGAAVSCGPTDAEASAALGLVSGGLAFWVAAARECFEEAGILLARDRDSGRWLDTSSEWVAARFARHRRAVHAGRCSLAAVLAAEDLVLDLGDVHYVSHWITPPGGSRRFDTRFFVAPAPSGQAASHDTRETVESVWTTPAGALERHAGREDDLAFPTFKNLQALAHFSSVAELLEAARSIGPVPVVAPRFEGDREFPAAVLDGALLAPVAVDPEPPCPT